MTDRLDFPLHYRGELEALLREHVPGVEVWAYGSRVNGRSHDGSDLDLVLRSPTLEPLGYEYAEFVEALEQSNIPIPVRAQDWARLPESLHREIEKDYVVLSGMNDERRETIYGVFPVDFIEESLVNLCDHVDGIQTGPFGSQLHQRDYVPVGTPIITVEHLGDNRIIHREIPRVSDYDSQRLSKYALRVGDIVFSRVGSVDRRSLVREEEDGWLFSGRCLRVRPNQEIVDPGYLSYFFGLPAFREHIRAVAVGATMPSLNTRILSDVTVLLPSLPEQQRIAGILSALDDKIELNRQMNETLEQMARSIFQDWFVDFGPSRAKLESRKPYLSPELWDLFPNRLVDSELGEIPEGWEVQALGDLCEKPQYGYTASAQSDSLGPKFLRITDINKIPWIEWANVPYCVASAQDRAKFLIRKGDVLIARMADPGHGVMVEEDLDAVFASYLIRFRPRNANHGRLLQYWLRSAAYWDLVQSRGAGTTRISLNAKVLSGFPVIVPPYQLAECFANTVQSIRNRVVANVAEIEGMTAQRDALLPKLVSCELRVGGAHNAESFC